MKQRAIGTGGSLKAVQPSNAAYEKPKKPVAKKKVTAADMKSTWLTPKAEVSETATEEGEEDKFASRAPVYTTDSNLVDFLQHFDAMNDDALLSAREYLLRGPPFRGRHDREYKLSIKELGLKWLKNPDHVEGVWDGQKFGWYVAHDVKELKAVLTMPRKLDGERAWSPCDMEELTTRAVNDLMERYADMRSKKEERARMEVEERRKAKEKALGKGGVAGDDSAEHIARLKQLMALGGFPDWEYDRELVASSSTFANLGPQMPTNALRVCRGLHLKIITAEQVSKRQWEPDDVVRKRKRDEAAAAERARRDDEEELKQQQSSRLKVLKAKAERATRVLQRDDDMEKPEQEAEQSVEIPYFLPADYNSSYTCRDTSLKPTVCRDCNVEIHEQFMDCACINRIWTKCTQCLVARAAAQGCACTPTERSETEAVLPPVDDDHSPVAEDAAHDATGAADQAPLSKKGMSEKARGKLPLGKTVRWEED